MSDITCGTHIHVSPGDSEWTFEQVQNISRSIFYFEEAFEVLLPRERRGNPECRSNRFDNPAFKHLPDLDACFQEVQKRETIKALVHLMNARQDSNLDELLTGEAAHTDRRYGFNFENLLEGQIGTIGMHDMCGKIPADNAQMLTAWRRIPPTSLYYELRGLRNVGGIRGFFHAGSHAVRYQPGSAANIWGRCSWAGGVYRASYPTGRE